ncbi:MAG TPA: helix-turn-helix domain-containing protein [Propionibacteriaceae bacterium]|nr:helix-turn-helix domain-containing protein [Propionibacteriaceae bacterium]
MTEPLGPGWLTLRQVAKLLDVRESTVRSWVARNRMPQPDGHVSRTPVWREGTIREWDAQRPRKKPRG